ncbi:EAL domain-containing protein [Clostridium sp. CS001]|uniref:EAL domain-containing protein n=1 Tax=Clostridium sp. CS001 TaxID=2880648 RepID=UPI001CF15484|nr:EAL domain-containing protein [Clostridium sp. CS001]MCB2290799.1 EAL domain-containing protein [Clostridium sp. CS001]
MSLSYIFSLVFFIAFAIYFIFGIYILSINAKSILNRLFFAACLSLCIWSFCFSIVNSAQNYETAIFWRRLTSLGWGTLYSILLHFFLILTERKKILKNKLLYVLLYLPVVVNIFVFGFSAIANEQFSIINTTAGWINVPISTQWNLYFNLYYVSFSTLGLWLLWNWGKMSKELVKKKQAYLLISAFAIALILGTISDMIVNAYMSFRIPQMAPIIILIPVTAIFYAIKRYGLMNHEKIDKAIPGKILSKVSMGKFIKIMSLVFIIGGMLNFASQYFFCLTHPSLNSILLSSTFFFIIGIALQFIHLIPIKADFQEVFFITIVVISILIITINYIQTASITMWATPFVIIMLSVLLNKRLMFFGMGISILSMQVYIWVRLPSVMVQIDGSDYIGRIGILSITLWLAYFVNRIYIQRLEENENQFKFQEMVSKISANFVTVNESNLNKKINYLLKMSGEHFHMDRTYYVSLSQELKTLEWCNEGIKPEIDIIESMVKDKFPLWVKHLKNSEVMYVPDVEMITLEASEEKSFLKSLNVKSLIIFPINREDQNLGFLFFTSIGDTIPFREDYTELMKILGNLLSDALIKVKAEKEISYMAYYDSLTTLPNRKLFENHLEQSIHLAKRSETIIGVIFIDLDSFKTINDTIGHFGGDEILKQVARRLSGCLRSYDTVSRFSGDEFLVQVTQIYKVEDIQKIAVKIIKSLAKPMNVNDQEFFITASIGVAVFPRDGEDFESLIKNADLAMYAAKDNGKNQYRLCSPDMKEDSLKEMMLTNKLYRALERNEFVLYYQPQVSILTKKIIGFEALLRWNNPELGMISPATFIPLAEKTGLIKPIGQWVLETAFHQSKTWQGMGLPPLRMSVNVSTEQFRDRKLISIVRKILSETGLETKYMELEITESTAIEGEDYIIEMLHALKDLGILISIDDFGTAYSSLSRLKELPIDQLKIDMQFVRGISVGNKDEAIAKTIIQLAKNLKLNVIAEGVETDAQFEFFKKHKCDEIQGFYFYKPMPASEIEPLLFNQFRLATLERLQ